MSSGSIKNRIQQNNTELNNVITTVETLPDYIDTSDADAVAGNIEIGKTAYVNDNLVTGTLPIASFVGNRNQSINVTCYDDYSLFDLSGKVSTIINGSDPSSPLSRAIIANNDDIEMMVAYSQVANEIGLTANKIKKDITILGVTRFL